MRAPRVAPAAAAAATLVALVALAACGSDAVSITPPDPTGTVASACQALDAALPDQVDGTASTATDPDSPYTAAWGDIVLTCGGAAPTVPADAQLLDIDDLSWFSETLPQGGARFSTVGRVATVSVIVPATRQPPSNALVDVGTAVKTAVPAAPSKP